MKIFTLLFLFSFVQPVFADDESHTEDTPLQQEAEEKPAYRPSEGTVNARVPTQGAQGSSHKARVQTIWGDTNPKEESAPNIDPHTSNK